MDFVEDIKKEITKTMPDVSPDWAELNGIIQVSTMLPLAEIIEQEKPMKLNLIAIMIGESGIKKSMPMTGWTLPLLRIAGNMLGKDFILPTRSSVPKFIEYISEKDEKTKDYIHNIGLIMRDEFSGFFKQARKETWQSDAMEFISELYDNLFQKRATFAHGLNETDTIHINLISCTTYHFINIMDKDFFRQGTGNRFLYCHYPIESYNPPDFDELEYFRENWGDVREKRLYYYAGKLKDIFDGKLEKMYVEPDAGKLWLKYKKDCETEWKEKCTEDKQKRNWKHYPVKRYAELALKLSGVYSVSRNVDKFPNLDRNIRYNFLIRLVDMERAITFVEKCRRHFIDIAKIKDSHIDTAQPKSQGKNALAVLAFLPEDGLTNNQWFTVQDITKSPNDFDYFKNYLIQHGFVKELAYADTPENLRRKHNMSGASKLYVPLKKV